MKSKKKIGRPSVGVTRKVSVTMSQESWTKLERLSEGNLSAYLRNLLEEMREPTYEPIRGC